MYKGQGQHFVGVYPTEAPGDDEPGPSATRHISGAYVHYERWVPTDSDNAGDMRRIAELHPWSSMGQHLISEPVSFTHPTLPTKRIE